MNIIRIQVVLIVRSFGMATAELKPELLTLSVNERSCSGKPVFEPKLNLCKEGDFIGKQVYTDEEGKYALTGGHAHDQAGHNAEPAGHMFQYQLGMPVPDQSFHAGQPSVSLS
jgi:hypothetical protein